MDSPFPYRLKSARLQQGKTQEELALAIGVSKQAISQYEHGKKQPDSQTLISLARQLGKSTSFFFRPVRTTLDQVEFRKKASLTGKQLAALKASIQDRLEPYLELEALLGEQLVVQNPLADHLITELEAVESAALALLHAWELGVNPIPNVLEMLEAQGIKVVELPLDARFDGLSTWVGDHLPIIVLNEQVDNPRKRFTALHELGHLLLSFPEDKDNKFREAACNRFAGALLLPAEVMKATLGPRRSKVSLSELIPLKAYHGISLAALMYRGQDLGIFPQRLMRRFWQRRNQNPELKQELGPAYGQYQGEERAFRFEQLLSRAIVEEIISLSKAASLSGRSLEALKHTYQLI